MTTRLTAEEAKKLVEKYWEKELPEILGQIQETAMNGSSVLVIHNPVSGKTENNLIKLGYSVTSNAYGAIIRW